MLFNEKTNQHHHLDHFWLVWNLQCQWWHWASARTVAPCWCTACCLWSSSGTLVEYGLWFCRRCRICHSVKHLKLVLRQAYFQNCFLNSCLFACCNFTSSVSSLIASQLLFLLSSESCDFILRGLWLHLIRNSMDHKDPLVSFNLVFSEENLICVVYSQSGLILVGDQTLYIFQSCCTENSCEKKFLEVCDTIVPIFCECILLETSMWLLGWAFQLDAVGSVVFVEDMEHFFRSGKKCPGVLIGSVCHFG